jgi:hypothetical protein
MRPLAESLHKKLSGCYRTAVEDVMADPKRWEPPTRVAVPSDGDLATSNAVINPASQVTPATLWAAPYSVLFHQGFKKPTVKTCICFARLAPTATDAYMCVNKDLSSKQTHTSELS